MAKKKTVTTVEEVDEPQLTPAEIQAQRISDERATKFLGEEVKDGKVVEPKEEVKEEVKEPEAPKEDETETVEFDPEAFKKEVAEQTRKELLETLQGNNKKETEENVDAYVKYQEEFNKTNNRQPTWFEVAKFMEEQALERLEAKQAAKAKEAEEERNKQAEVVQKNTEETNKYIESTLNELYENEKLPQIQNKEDKDDYGLKVQHALIEKVVEVNSKRIQENLPPKTLKEIFYEDFELPRKEVAGANAPTNMGRGGYTPDETQELDYRDITGPRNTFKNILQQAIKRR
jgi:hypothetical protein